jgi:osmotically-inducible protein OsmY
MRRLLLAAALAACGCPEPRKSPEEARVEDHSIASDVSRALSRVKTVDRLRIRIEVSGGVVTLSGKVDDGLAACDACAAAHEVKGVKEVVDRLERMR